jgi:hypothetical protein
MYLLEAAYLRIIGSAAFQALIGVDVGMDDVSTDPWYGGWVFQGLSDENAPYRQPEGSGMAAVVVSSRGGWASPNQTNTAHFPLLSVFIFGDCSRDANGNLSQRDAEVRVRRVADVIDPLFHDPANRTHVWGTFPIVSCLRHSELNLQDVPSGDGVVRGELTYEIVID